MLMHSHMPSTIRSPCPSFIGNTIHNDNCMLRIRHVDDRTIISTHRSCKSEISMLSNTKLVDFPYSDRIGEKNFISSSGISRKRPRSILRMSNLPEEDSNKRKDRRQTVELSLFDKFIDKLLTLNGPSIIVLLTIITILILPSDVAFYSGQNLALNSIFIFLGLQQDIVQKSSSILPTDDAEDDVLDFKAYILATWCLGVVFVTYLDGPYEFGTEAVVKANDTFFLSKVLFVTLLSVGLLSTSGVMALPFGKDEESVIDDKAEEDTLYTSAEKELMELWDQEMEKSTKADGHDG